jgi:uncharacterized protein involved in exopolysaccharide biosynthesis
LAGSGLGSLAALAGKDVGLKKPDDLYVGILKSRTIEDALVQSFELQGIYHEKKLSDTRRELERSTTISAGKEGLISIAVEDADPERAVQMANAYVTELRDLLQHLAVTEAGQRRLFFEQQLQQTKDDLANAEIALKETQQKTGMLQLDSQSRAIIEAIGRIRAQVAAKEVQLHAMGSFATEQNPDYVLARQELEGLRAQLAKFEQQSPDTADPILASGKIPSLGLEYVRRVREVKYREAMFELMAKQYEAAKLDEAKEAAVVQVVDPAVKPDKKSSPKMSIFILLAAMLGLIGSVGCVLISEAISILRRDPRQASRLHALSVSLHRTSGLTHTRD